MIDKRLAEAGIAIAFPQRDVHLSASAPLEIRMAPPAVELPAETPVAEKPPETPATVP